MAQGPIKNCFINLKEEYVDSKNYGHDREVKYSLEIDIKLPGGRALYSIPIDKEISESMKFAQQLSEKK